ncbi:radical SAM protein [Acidaminobacter sp. JC074]|uniref:B12-binding domain-containing radical SAM protein n=1 Tax=Acidaminobacter sp. JC074 TaxID=2530199 RepID=UPI001F0F25E9|nr:radical SAM protein [Acidaminobacter sp. JC074]MCH4889671.1 radical SAM protein [Acidaminobacter sp. JC074]
MKKYIRKSTTEKVKVCVIKASAKSEFKDYKKSMLGLPQNIFSLAACTPDYVTLQMVDETVGVKVDFQTQADIVMIMFHTPDAIRAYELADKFKAKGKTVVLGGLHTSFMSQEALSHAHAILVGECEGIWEELLEDYLNGQLKSKYERDFVFDLKDLKPYPTDILPTELYDYSWTVTVSRGCPNKCSYCTVHKFFPSYRKRPIADIVEEIKNAPTDFIELKADNLTIDRNYCLELFKALEPLDIIWMTALEPEFAEDKELVDAAAKSGMRVVLLGIETPSREALKDNNKGHLALEKVKEQIAYLHDLDVEVDSAMLFGFDEHDKTIFAETLEYALDIDLDITHGVVPIPFPGTELYKSLSEAGRIETRDWSKYDGTRLVFKHPNFTDKELYEKTYWYEKEFIKRHKKRDFKWKHRWDNKPVKTKSTQPIKWKTISAILLVIGAILFEMPMLFGLLYIFWAILDIKTGHAYIIEDISRHDNPILFWIIVILWMSSGFYILVENLLF